MNKTLIVGTVAYDEIETSKGSSGKILGGAGTYIALATAHFNSKSAIVSVVGGDFKKRYLNLLESKGIDISSIEMITKGKTFSWKGKYHKDWNKRDTLSTQLNVLAEFRPVVPEEFKSAEIVILGNLHPFVQTSVLNQIIKKPKCIILDTMNFWMDNSLTELLEVISRTDVLVINDEEAKQLSQQESLFTAADEILKMGPKYLVIKKGEHGAMLFGDSQFFTSPAFPVKEVIDPTGAGDTFAGGFGGYLSESTVINFEILKSAIAYGTVMASFCVEKFGTMAMENLKKEKVLERLKVFKKYTAYSL
jgi:sugar/nucleoside kinase (ribokinase family)|tara:strand:- start:11497 stop:12414 length:918 start_codon:yes stop_codon:yes gene_type:complete